MVFSSTSFVWFFLPCVFALYYLLPSRPVKNGVLLFASLFVFYAWGEPKFLLLMLADIAVAYFGGLAIHGLKTAGKPRGEKAVFVLTVLLLLAGLFTFKYLNFFAENISRIPGVSWQLPAIALPIGISFYTFQILSYVIDLHKGEVGVQKNPLYLALYVSFFPQLIAGPIVRYRTVESEIRGRKESLSEVAHGLRRFICGLAKKVIIANGVSQIAEAIYSNPQDAYGTGVWWIAAVCYTLQIYFDFSGYSDMAIGMGRMFGFHFLENFDYPYISCSITEFWRRWHISLSSWFRDYVYIPLGGSRAGGLRQVFNLLIVWALTGLWHGAQWNFVIWGLYYLVLLLIEKFILSHVLKHLPKVFGWVYTMFFVICGWVIFNMPDVASIREVFTNMFTYKATDWAATATLNASVMVQLPALALGLIFMFPVVRRYKKEPGVFKTMIANVFCLALFALCLIFLLSETYDPFIYFRF